MSAHLRAAWRSRLAIQTSKGGVLEMVPLREVLDYNMVDAMSETWADIRAGKLEQAKSGSAQFSSWGLDSGESSLYESIRDEGFWEPIFVVEEADGQRWVVDGHTRLAVAEDLRWTQVPIEVLNRSSMSPYGKPRVASMGPYPPFPEGFVFEPPLYRSMLSPGQRVIISHPDLDVEVEGTVTGEIPTTGILMVQLPGVDGLVQVPLSMVRSAVSYGYGKDPGRVAGRGRREGGRGSDAEALRLWRARLAGDLYDRGPGSGRRSIVGAGQITIYVSHEARAQYNRLQANQRKVVLALVKDIQRNGFPASAKAQTGPLKGHVRVRFSGMGGAEWRLIFKQEGGGHYTLIYVGPREGIYGSRMTGLRKTAVIYERVRFEDQGRIKTVILRDPSESDLLLTGIEVNKEGDEISGKGYDERLRVIELSLVKDRTQMVMDNMYGELKEASTWRGFTEGDVPFWQQHDVVIATQRRGRERYYETWVRGMNYGNFPRLEEAKTAIEQTYGSLDWVQDQLPKVWVEHYYFGWTTEFTDPLVVYYADF